MKRNFALLLSAWMLLVWVFSSCASENDALSLAPVEREFPLRVSPSNQNMYMDGPDALNEVKQRNQEIIDSRRFPWLWLVLFIGCAGIGWAAFLFRDEWIEYFQKRVESLSPLQQIYAKLQALQQVQPREVDQYKAYYGELSTLLKEALQVRLQADLISLTTEEINSVLGISTLLSDNEKREILALFAQADTIKYANLTSTEQEADNFFDSVQLIVNRIDKD